jgi:hypothetical protein
MLQKGIEEIERMLKALIRSLEKKHLNPYILSGWRTKQEFDDSYKKT